MTPPWARSCTTSPSRCPELIRSEIRLAQAEMTEKGKRAGLGIGMFSAAGLLALFGVGA